ncbi:redox-sensing transcriptional repressor Rex [Bacillaceae bacterium W0354]
MKEDRIPQATAKRLPLYYRQLNLLHNQGKRRISSRELSEIIKVDPATIRKDFSYFGELGRKGYGYDINHLIQFFKKLLDHDEVAKVALIGVGNLGTALLHYNFMKKDNTRIEVAFDQNKSKVGQTIADVPIYHIDELEKVLVEKNIIVAILTVPARVAQEITNRLVASGVEGILNFTPSRLTVPDHIRIHHIDLSIELQSLIYFLRN